MKFQKLLKNKPHEAGASLVEMALLVALIAVIAIPSVSWMGESTKEQLSVAGDHLTGEGAICDPQDPLCDE